uniref:Uncharacterized protein n=1 Tax=Arundo donax TaxID=35708 RepID=A0A0A8YAG3_ARUDO
MFDGPCMSVFFFTKGSNVFMCLELESFSTSLFSALFHANGHLCYDMNCLSSVGENQIVG